MSKTLEALTVLMQSSTGNNKDPAQTRVNQPESFTGQDPKKLAPFLVQCRLNFRDRPAAFASDDRKVNFALSYLKDTAAAWFEPAFSDFTTEEPDWLHDWSAFVKELQTNFGPYDQVGDAETALSNLKMKDNQRITEYMVQFNNLVARCDWGDSALRYQFYSGLPSRLKDEVSSGETGKPKTLAHMRLKAQNADARYWERRLEIAREVPSDKPNKAPFNKTVDYKSGSQYISNYKNISSPTTYRKPDIKTYTSNKDRTPQPVKPVTSGNLDLVGKLGSDGKLTTQEKQRRTDNNLCWLCADPGHRVINCPKATKARSVNSEASDPLPQPTSDLVDDLVED
jgi:hypothetical protein